MDSRRALPFVAAAAAAALAIALFVSRRDGDARSIDPAPDRATTPTAAPSPAAAALATRADAAPEVASGERSSAALAGSSRIEGRVTTESGEPVPGVTVHASAGDDAPRWAIEPSGSDLQGRYRIAVHGPGTYGVHARGAGWVTKGFSDTTAPGRDPIAVVVGEDGPATRDLVVVRGAEATGVVTGSEGRPVAGAVVSARSATAPESGALLGAMARLTARTPVETSATNADGEYRLSTLVAGEDYEIYVTGEWLPAILGPFRAALDRPIRADFRMQAGRWIDVTVLSEDAKPIAGAKVVAMPKEPTDLDSLRGWGGWRWRTDTAGRARVGPFAAVDVGVSVFADGYLGKHGTDEGGERTVPPMQAAVEFRLARGGSVAGKVVDAAGRPVPGVMVQALRRTVSPNGIGILGFDSVHTGADGGFRIGGLPPGTLTVRAGTFDAPVAEQASADVESGATGIVLTMGEHPEDRVVTLRIVGPDGSPVPRATVKLGTYESHEAVDGQVDVERDSLVFGAEVRDPRDARGNRLPFAPARVEIPGDNVDRVIEVRLVVGRSVAGRVLGPDGAGVPNVEVDVEVDVEDEESEEAVAAPLRAVAARTDERGAFRIEGVPEGAHSLRVRPPADFVPPKSVDVEAGTDDVEIRLRAGVRPWVKVVDAKGAPVAGVTVSAQVSDASPVEEFGRGLGEALGALFVGSRRTDAEGRIRLDALDPAVSYSLTVRPPPSRRDLAPRFVEGWRPKDDVVELAAGHTVTGVVRSPSGDPVPGAQVISVAAGHEQPVEAGADGRFEVKDLPPGRVELRAFRPGRFHSLHTALVEPERMRLPLSSPPVVVEAGAREVVLTLDLGESLTLRVADAPEDLDKRTVVLVSERDPEEAFEGKIVLEGRGANLGFRGLERGETYALWISPSAESPLSLWRAGLRVGRDPGDLRLSAAGITRGRVILPKGEDEVVVVAERGAASYEMKAATDGSFEMPLPPGRWTFVAWRHSRASVLRSSVDAEAGTTVELPMPAPWNPAGR